MLEMFNAGIQGILKLLKLQKDAKKIDLETQKLAREEKQATSLFKIATDEDIKKYDPRVAAIDQLVKRQEQQRHRRLFPDYNRSPLSFLPLIFIVLIIAVIVLLVRMFLHLPLT
jgi:hypothetical protein